MFNLYHYGNPLLKIQPYKYLHNYRTDLKTLNEKHIFDRARVVMKAIDKVAIDNGLMPENETNFSKLDQTISFEIFDRVFPLLVSQCYDDQNNNKNKRTHDKTLSTIAAKVYAMNKRQINAANSNNNINDI